VVVALIRALIIVGAASILLLFFGGVAVALFSLASWARATW